jgi:hypothetical protein
VHFISATHRRRIHFRLTKADTPLLADIQIIFEHEFGKGEEEEE